MMAAIHYNKGRKEMKKETKNMIVGASVGTVVGGLFGVFKIAQHLTAPVSYPVSTALSGGLAAAGICLDYPDISTVKKVALGVGLPALGGAIGTALIPLAPVLTVVDTACLSVMVPGAGVCGAIIGKKYMAK